MSNAIVLFQLSIVGRKAALPPRMPARPVGHATAQGWYVARRVAARSTIRMRLMLDRSLRSENPLARAGCRLLRWPS